MVYSFSEVLKKYGTRHKIDVALKNGEIYRVKRDVYADEQVVNPIVEVSKKYSTGIITMDSAFYYYGLTTVVPTEVHLATSRNANTIKDSGIIQYFIPKEIFDVGKVQVYLQGNIINIYDRERLLVELVRKRNRLSFEYYKEIVNNYREIKGELDYYKLERYIFMFKNAVKLWGVLRREVF